MKCSVQRRSRDEKGTLKSFFNDTKIMAAVELLQKTVGDAMLPQISLEAQQCL